MYDNTECSFQKTISVSLHQDTESDPLPSIESLKSDNSRPSSPEDLTLHQSSQSLPSSPLSSSSSSLEVFASSDEPKNRYYQNDPLMQIYKISSKSIDTKEATAALITTEDEDVIAKNNTYK